MFRKVFILVAVVALSSCANKFSEKEKKEYFKKGKEITQVSFNELSSQLMIQMNAGGPAKAIPFCKEEAINILAKLSEKHNVLIKRSSDQLRSCKIEPTIRELDVVNNYKKLVSEKKDLKPIVEIDDDGNKHFYSPILIQAQCLTCHGTVNETMTVKIDSIIKSIYPFDIATGYNIGDVRGIWSITFNE